MLQGVVPAMPNGTAGALPQTSHDSPTDNSSAATTTGPGVLPHVRSLHLARCVCLCGVAAWESPRKLSTPAAGVCSAAGGPDAPAL